MDATRKNKLIRKGFRPDAPRQGKYCDVAPLKIVRRGKPDLPLAAIQSKKSKRA